MPYAGNPNSANQTWSRWTFTVTPGSNRRALVSKAEMVQNCSKAAVLMWGHAGQMKIDQQVSPLRLLQWKVDIRIEGAPVQDPLYRERCIRTWAKLFRDGFGPGTHTHCDTKLEAGDPANGQPREQLIIIPPLALPTRAT